MKAVKCLVILMALAYCVEGRERLGKIFKRQARHREDKAIQGPQAGSIPQTVVHHTFAQPQNQLPNGPTQGSEINVPLILPESRPAPYQQAQQPIPPNQILPINPYPFPEVRQASYSEISLAEALKSSQYSQALVQAFQTSPNYAQPITMRDVTNKILMRLPSNATLIRPNIIDGFSCAGRPYGYYADVPNDCQLFHICFPLKSVFKHDKVPDVTYEYSFICNEFTRFSQDSLTCAWTYEAVPCKDSELLYSINDHFFKITTPVPHHSYGLIPGPIGGSVQVGGLYPSAFP